MSSHRPFSAGIRERVDATCDDCYFHRSDLCALTRERPCPTYRPFTRGSFAPPPQPRLLPELGRLAAQYAAAS